MKLFTDISGSGPDLVLIHGWGLHGGIWDTLVPFLEADFRVTRVDLPGHGHSAWQGDGSLAGMAAAVLSVAPQKAAWAGWSLGGMVAAQAALAAPERIGALVLLASTPSFVRRPDWQAALLPALLETFTDDLRQDYLKTLSRFLSLQVRGSDAAGPVLRELRSKMLQHGQPAVEALQAGLGILRGIDLRRRYAEIACPTLFLMGERDTLVPAAAGRQAAKLVANARIRFVAGAGHAPFLARPDEVAAAMREFLRPASGRRAERGHG